MKQSDSYLGRHFTWTLTGNLVYSLCQWSFVVALAKLGKPEDVGAYALGVAVTSPLLIFAGFQGRNLVASDIRNRYSFDEYFTFRILSLTVALALVAAVVACMRTTGSTAVIVLLVGLSQAFELASETYFGLLQKHDRLDWVAQSLLLRGPLCLFLLTLSMLATHSLTWAVASVAAARCGMLILFDSRKANLTRGPVRVVFQPRTQAKLLLEALPLGILSGLVALNLNVPRYFIEADLSKRDLGIFSALASLVGAGNLVMTALANCRFVSIATAFADGNARQYRALSLRLFGTAAVLGSAGVLMAALAGEDILVKLFGPEYAGGTGVLARIMVAGALGYITSGQGYAITAARSLLPQIPVLLCTIGTTVLFSWWLVRRYGLTGAADAWILGSLVQLAFGTLVMGQTQRRAASARACPAGEHAVSANAV